jgi:hypothetical protein
MSTLAELVAGDPIEMRSVTGYLDDLDPAKRAAEVLALGRREQAKLFESAQGHRPTTLEHIVGNTLPFFSHFAKVFVRPDTGPGEELWGYNRSGPFVETVVGPGYFVARPHEAPGELLVDYLRVPPRRPSNWPEIIPNSARLSAFVYKGTQDVLRGVSEHVTIGRAFKKGRPLDAWFVLCRQTTGRR